MAAALSLARRGLGNVWPNPAVGCVIVRDGRVVGRGWTQPGGRPHAETEALDRAGELAAGATAYITLEPCHHQGATPPCSAALIEAGIARAVIALEDPDLRTNGQGRRSLEKAGIEVEVGPGAAAAAAINQGFIRRVEQHRPLFTLKIAATLDGRIATAAGESQWITGPEARRQGHGLRARHDAVLVGSGTALADDPALTCRLAGIANDRRPRIVIDGRLRLSVDSQLVATIDQAPLWLVTTSGQDKAKLSGLRQRGVEIIELTADEAGHPRLDDWLGAVAERGLTRVLVEGGGRIAAALLKADVIDRIAWFHAPAAMGADARPALAELSLAKLSDMTRFERQSIRELGADVLEILVRK